MINIIMHTQQYLELLKISNIKKTNNNKKEKEKSNLKNYYNKDNKKGKFIDYTI